jgi:beta-phosphoglucomutase family hydrolase
MKSPNMAVLFDMDGVLVDNMAYHKDSWFEFCRRYGVRMTDEEFTSFVSGRVSREVLEYLFNKPLSAEEISRYTEEKEELYRNIYRPHIKPTEGLVEFLQSLKQKQVALAVGTSAPTSNIDFTLVTTGLRPYFDQVVDASFVKRGKPDPEIYLKAAEMLHVPPQNCVVVEDSLLGIQAGISAGMKVIGITTTHTQAELSQPHLIINNFHEVNYEKVLALLDNHT